jgi:hypothetical protein
LPGWEANSGPFDFIYFLIFTTLPLGHSGSPREATSLMSPRFNVFHFLPFALLPLPLRDPIALFTMAFMTAIRLRRDNFYLGFVCTSGMEAVAWTPGGAVEGTPEPIIGSQAATTSLI